MLTVAQATQVQIDYQKKCALFNHDKKELRWKLQLGHKLNLKEAGNSVFKHLIRLNPN